MMKMCQRMPYDLYQCFLVKWMRMHMPMMLHGPARWYYTRVKGYPTVNSRQTVLRPKDKANIYTLISMVDHIDIKRTGLAGVRYIVGRLVWRTSMESFLQLGIECLDRLAARIENFKDRRYVMSGGLLGIPLKAVRDCLIQHGASLDVDGGSRVYIAAGNGMNDILSEYLPRLSTDDIIECRHRSPVLPDVSYSLFELACRGGYEDTVLLLAKRCLVGPFRKDLAKKLMEVAAGMGSVSVWDTLIKSFDLDFTGIGAGFSNVGSDFDIRYLIQHNADTTDIVSDIAALGFVHLVEYVVDVLKYPMPSYALLRMFDDRFPFIDIIEASIRRGADVNAHDEDNNTVFHLGPLYSRFFLDFGGDPTKINSSGMTVLHCLAIKKVLNCHDLIDVLVHDYGVDVNAHDNNGKTALHLTCCEGGELVDALICAGADITVHDNDNKTPYHYATRHHVNSEICHKLMLC